MSLRSFTALALVVAALAVPTAAALPRDVQETAGGAVSFAAETALAAYSAATDLLAPEEEPAPESPPAPQEPHPPHEEHPDHGAPSAPAEEREPAREPSLLDPVVSLVPVPLEGIGPAPRIDLAYIERQVQRIEPLAPAPASSSSAGPRAAVAPASVEPVAAPAARESAPIEPAAVVVAAAAATAGSTGSAAATLWDRLRRLGWLALLYSRIAKERLLDHGSRERLLDAIRARPGLAVTDIARETDLPRNTVTYHLHVLEREGLVSSTRNGRNRLFFAPGSLEKRVQADALATLRHTTTLAMARAIGETPGVDQKALCERVGVSPSLAHWHADRLVATGLVDKRREGRSVRYYPGAAFDLVNARAA